MMNHSDKSNREVVKDYLKDIQIDMFQEVLELDSLNTNSFQATVGYVLSHLTNIKLRLEGNHKYLSELNLNDDGMFVDKDFSIEDIQHFCEVNRRPSVTDKLSEFFAEEFVREYGDTLKTSTNTNELLSLKALSLITDDYFIKLYSISKLGILSFYEIMDDMKVVLTNLYALHSINHVKEEYHSN